jgi:hypothetical protein
VFMSVVALVSLLTLSLSQDGQRCGTVHLPAAAVSQLRQGLAGGFAAGGMAGRSFAGPSPSLGNSEHFTIAWMPASFGSRDSLPTAMAQVAVGDTLPEAIRLGLTSLESAWRLYVDTMGMRPPLAYDASWHWGVAPIDGRYVIEFLTTDNGNFNGLIPSGSFYYGLTIPRGDAGQCNFAVAANWTNGGMKPWSYMPDTASTPESKIGHDFVKDWREGLAATLVHELFHAVQFRYDRSLDHFFFEASAVGMEERSAPWTQDWLYYAPWIYGGLPELTSTAYGKLYMYGEGLWVQSLVQDCGDGYQARFWKDREDRGGDVYQTMVRTMGTGCAGGFEQVFGRHSLRLLGSGKRSDWLPASENGKGLQGFRLAKAMPPLLHDTAIAGAEISGAKRTLPRLSPRFFRLPPQSRDVAVALGTEGAAMLVEGGDDGARRNASQLLLPASSQERWIGVVNAANQPVAMWLGMGTAPDRDSLVAGSARTWTVPGGRLTGTVTAGQGSRIWGCTGCWIPSGADGVAQLADTSRILRIHDFSGSLRLDNARILLDKLGDSLESAYMKRGDTPWAAVGTTWNDGAPAIELGSVSLDQPLTILMGASIGASGPKVGDPYPNPARRYHVAVKFPVQIWSPGMSVTILAADGAILQKLVPASDRDVVEWNLKTGSGNRVRPGIYFYRWSRVGGAHEGRIVVAE